MLAFLAPTLALAGAGLLVTSGLGHVMGPDSLGLALSRQDLVPRRLRPLVVRGIGPLEVIAGSAAGALVLIDRVPPVVAWGVTALGAAYTTFLLALARFRPGAPCGCAGSIDHGVGPPDIGRAAMVLAGGLALAADAGGRLGATSGPEAATTIVAGVALAAVVSVVARSERRRAAPMDAAPAAGARP